MALYGLYSGFNRHSVGIECTRPPRARAMLFRNRGIGPAAGPVPGHIIPGYGPGINNLLIAGQYFRAGVFPGDNPGAGALFFPGNFCRAYQIKAGQ